MSHLVLKISNDELDNTKQEALKLASWIAKRNGTESTEEQRAAYCLALYTAGASIHMPDNAFNKLLTLSRDFDKQCPTEVQEQLAAMRNAASEKQDFDYSDWPGLACLFYTGKSGFHTFPAAAKIDGNLPKQILTRCFIQVATNHNAVLPIFEQQTGV